MQSSKNIPRLRQIRHSACPVPVSRCPKMGKCTRQTLYQCFLTEPSVRLGNVCDLCQYLVSSMWCKKQYLGDLRPGLIFIAHFLQALLLGWSPGRVSATLLEWGSTSKSVHRGRCYRPEEVPGLENTKTSLWSVNHIQDISHSP